MTPVDFPDQAAALCDLCRLFGERQWCLATGGNFSTRVDDHHCLVTQSGVDKSKLSPSDLMICDTRGQAVDPNLTPSAEMALHACLYRHDPGIAAVLHTHSVWSTLVSRGAGPSLEMRGFEMQKALRDIDSHETAITVPVFENSQDMRELTRSLTATLEASDRPLPGFLVRGHGLYAWGDSLAEAQRHIEGFEFLLECTWREMCR